jgi:hypothetical protein
VSRLANLATWARAFRDLPADVAHTYARVRELQHALNARPLPPEPLLPFVCVLVEGMGPKGPLTAGTTARVRRDNVHMLELTTHTPMRFCRVTVFADLERVDVGGIFVGSDYMHAALGTCPIAFVPEWPVGVWLRVQASLRRGES